jgi:tetratricopeptide (TPR) repeat protein
MSSRRHAIGRVAALISLFAAGAGVDVRAGSLDDFNKATNTVRGTSRDSHLETVALYSAALAADLTDKQLSIAQRAEAVVSRGERLFLLKRYDEALSDLSSLIDGMDPRVGVLAATHEIYGLAVFWRALCYADMGQTEKAAIDIDRAYELLPDNLLVERMRDTIRSRLKPKPT